VYAPFAVNVVEPSSGEVKHFPFLHLHLQRRVPREGGKEGGVHAIGSGQVDATEICRGLARSCEGGAWQGRRKRGREGGREGRARLWRLGPWKFFLIARRVLLLVLFFSLLSFLSFQLRIQNGLQCCLQRLLLALHPSLPPPFPL
jgi:hypothetical protein